MPTDQTIPESSKTKIRQIFRHDFKGVMPDPEPLRLANDPPPWRNFGKKSGLEKAFQARTMDIDQTRRGQLFQSEEFEANMVNAALILRRPLLIAGLAGVGKTSLAYAIAWQLGLGNVLRWSITSRSTLKEALYEYDAIARLQDSSLEKSGIKGIDSRDIGQYITLGPLGTALLPNTSGPYQPRVLLIDEIDKSDIDLPNDLLHVLEEGTFEIREIARYKHPQKQETVAVKTWRDTETADIPVSGIVTCTDFPLVILTTNGEREFSPAFRRRCLEIKIKSPQKEKLERIIRSQLNLQGDLDEKVQQLLDEFESKARKEQYVLAVDQLLNAIYLIKSNPNVDLGEFRALLDTILHSITEQTVLS